MRISLVVILMTALAVCGCNGKTPSVNSNQSNANANSNITALVKPPEPLSPTSSVDPTFKACNPYFPLVPGSVAKYVIQYSSGLVADLTVVVDGSEENGRKVFIQRSQLVDRSGGTQIVQKIVRKFACDGERVVILSETTEGIVAGMPSSSEFNYRENSVMMPDPQTLARKGSTWSHGFYPVFHSPQQPEAKSDVMTVVGFEVGAPEQATTPVGAFRTLTINRKVGENLVVDYYAPGIGLVKRMAKEGTTWEISEYSGLKTSE